MNAELYGVLLRRHFIFGTVTWRYDYANSKFDSFQDDGPNIDKVYEIGECEDDIPHLRELEVDAIINTQNIFRYDASRWCISRKYPKLVARYNFKCLDYFIRVYHIKVVFTAEPGVVSSKTEIVGAFTDVHYQNKLYLNLQHADHITKFDKEFEKDRDIIEKGIDLDLAHVTNI
jgi:hypothetical protein